MDAYIPIPAKGDALKATWAAQVANGINALARLSPAGMLVREGAGCGTEPLPVNQRNRTASAAVVHPWKVYAQTQSEEVDHCFEIYVPDASLTVGGTALEIEGLTKVENADSRYTFDDEDQIGDATTIFVAVVRSDGESESGAASASEDEDEASDGYAAKIVISKEMPEEDEDEPFVSIFPVARVSVDNSGDYAVGTVESQFARSVVALSEPGRNPDGISTDTVTADDAEDPNAFQIKDFDNEESDSEQGLTQRIEVVKDGDGEDATYSLKAKDHEGEVYLLARVNGKIRYIPLTGTVEEEEDEEKPEEETPCDHPGSEDDNGGVSADDDSTIHGTDGTSDGSAQGGVAAEGESHPGNDCNTCNT